MHSRRPAPSKAAGTLSRAASNCAVTQAGSLFMLVRASARSARAFSSPKSEKKCRKPAAATTTSYHLGFANVSDDNVQRGRQRRSQS